MRQARLSRLGLALPVLALACTSGALDSGGTRGSNGDDPADYVPPDQVPESLSLESVFGVPERAWDLATSPDGILYCSAQSGGKLYSWDPVEQDRDEETDDLSGIRALAFSGDQLYMTLSNQGVTGSLAVRDGRTAEVLYTQADDGTLFRDPVDLISDGSEGWLLADYKAPGLFHIQANGSVSFMDSGTSSPIGLALQNAWLWIAGDDGVWRMDWPGGVAELVDIRAANGLLVVGDAVWAASSADDLFVVGGDTMGGDELARPGSMALAGDGGVFVADRVGEDVWLASP